MVVFVAVAGLYCVNSCVIATFKIPSCLSSSWGKSLKIKLSLCGKHEQALSITSVVAASFREDSSQVWSFTQMKSISALPTYLSCVMLGKLCIVSLSLHVCVMELSQEIISVWEDLMRPFPFCFQHTRRVKQLIIPLLGSVEVLRGG